ncbi:MAG TPA: hypothetical protein DCP31_24690 [Cyanobacteria bacterium UBA8543]|nr:hypothetical protein [Cyanobacteria bacterium UBA8543]
MTTSQKATPRFLSIFFNQSHTTFVSLLVLSFLFLQVIGIIHHEMWRDELHAWMIARDSSSISDLFNNLRYEGHPALWHLCLYFLSRVTRNPLAMQVFHLGISVLSVYIFVKFSPFTRLQKILFTFGYFPLFEYGIISRNYSFGVLLIFLFCIFFQNRYKNYLVLAILLSLMANTNAFTFIVAVCLAITLVFERIIESNSNRLFSNSKWNLILSVTIFVAGVIIALLQLIPPSDSDFTGDKEQVFQQSRVVLINIERIASSIARIWKIYVPIPSLQYNFWDTNILTDESSPTILRLSAVVLSLGLLFISTTLFIRKPVILFMYLSVTLGILLFHYLKFKGSMRHSGYLFVIFLACLWISKNWNKTIYLNRSLEQVTSFFRIHQNQYLNILLCIHVMVGIFAFSMDLKYPFSASKEVVSFIESQQLQEALIVGSGDMEVSPIAAILDQKIYYPESKGFGTFVKWNQRKKVNNQEIIDQVNQLIVNQKRPKVLLILHQWLDKPKAERPDLSISELYHSSQSLALDETYHLYLIQKKPVDSQLNVN